MTILKYGVGVFLAIILLGVIFYEFIVPSRMSTSYLHQLNANSQRLKNSFDSVAKTTNLDIFNNPDETPKRSLDDLAAIKKVIKDCHAQLSQFRNSTSDIKRLPLTGYTSSLHNAQVQREHAQAIVAESDDVLQQYERLADYLSAYIGYENTFIQNTSAVNAVSNLDTLAPDIAQLNNKALQLHAIASDLRKPGAPDDFKQLAVQASPIFEQAANGFDYLSAGLLFGDDTRKSTGIQLIEMATDKYDSTVNGLLSDLSQKAYLLQQVDELPDKIENLLS